MILKNEIKLVLTFVAKIFSLLSLDLIFNSYFRLFWGYYDDYDEPTLVLYLFGSFTINCSEAAANIL